MISLCKENEDDAQITHWTQVKERFVAQIFDPTQNKASPGAVDISV
jgi:hypothetical protein